MYDDQSLAVVMVVVVAAVASALLFAQVYLEKSRFASYRFLNFSATTFTFTLTLSRFLQSVFINLNGGGGEGGSV